MTSCSLNELVSIVSIQKDQIFFRSRHMYIKVKSVNDDSIYSFSWSMPFFASSSKLYENKLLYCFKQVWKLKNAEGTHAHFKCANTNDFDIYFYLSLKK